MKFQLWNQFQRWCVGLNENTLHRLMCLNTWSPEQGPVGKAVQPCWRKHRTGGRLWVPIALSHVWFMLCFVFVTEDELPEPHTLAACCHASLPLWTLLLEPYIISGNFLFCKSLLVMMFNHSNRKWWYRWMVVTGMKQFIIVNYVSVVNINELSPLHLKQLRNIYTMFIIFLYNKILDFGRKSHSLVI